MNGHTIKKDLNLNSGNFNYTYKLPKNLLTKTYNVTYIYTGAEYFESTELTINLHILKNETKLTASNISSIADQKIIFKGKVMDVNNKPVTTGRVAIKLNGKTINSRITLNKNGEFKYYYYRVPNYSTKKYKLTYVYVESKDFARTETERTLIIKKQTSNISAKNITTSKGKQVRFTVKVSGKKTGIKALDGTVGLRINGKVLKIKNKKYIQKIRNGQVTFKFTLPKNLNPGKYNITITYSGGRNLQKSKLNRVLTIKN